MMPPASADDLPETGGGEEAAPAGLDHAVTDRASETLTRLLSSPLKPGLYLVATPIGNLGDITLRALAVLANADVIYCEDTRHSRTLLAHYSIRRPLQPYHEHNAAEQRPRVLTALERGRRVALISDAGTPLVSDPGFKLTRAAIAAGHHVEHLPGASAGIAALTVSGLPSDAFLFAGFLPPKSQARQARLRELASSPATLIFFEAPQRTADTLADMAAVLGAREGAVARELTKMHEEVARGMLGALAGEFAGREVKGEIVILVGPPHTEAASDDAIRAKLTTALENMTLRDAAKAVSEALGVPKARVYDLGLAIKRGGP
jgi:16S rRNA (cytidine1402-2'-O)-methyltransferase